ncbi:MAG: DUF1385 domain-containing protein [Clostridia bacterium]|nr:DUF1385 domain-containing protein [Clostridia bacterium]
MNQTCKKTSIGGQALIEGILMRGPRKTAIVVRKSDGTTVRKEDEVGTSSHGRWARAPFVRGVVNFWDSMKYGIGALNYSASFFEEGEGEPQGKFERWLTSKFGAAKIDKFFMALATVLGVALPIVLFMLLPTLIAGFFGKDQISIVRNLIEGLIRILIFLAFLYLTSKQKDVRRTYMYHGAEHKTIACYEAGLPLTVENARLQNRRHPRCGTSFLFVVIIVSILFTSLFTWSSPVMRVVIRLALLPLIVGVSYEINRWCGRCDNLLSRVLRAPGLFMQNFTTYEPEDGMLEVAIEALSAVIPENETEDRW